MSGWVICWPKAHGKNSEIWKLVVRRCIWIPILVDRRLPPIKPGPPPEVHGPLPDPWLLGSDLSHDVQYRLQVLASIHALAEVLEPKVRATFQKLAQESVGKLPDDVEIHFDGSPQKKG